eukprot:CAMPEP_0114115404 /NCGR_PEP_ID=MMETSP0043_2-20121206/3954_1 /TAXON_ID=464988 /ORGANISM="Hemiselmis andersenii, Strain CCMP644" /LENGTH=161 /DNA_ID=CAMNT_0001207671 /DNA_START=35 /DNA_END=520 /DNA_ORIENTATION=+
MTDKKGPVHVMLPLPRTPVREGRDLHPVPHQDRRTRELHPYTCMNSRPHAERLVERTGYERCSVGAYVHIPHHALVPLKFAYDFLGDCVPAVDLLVLRRAVYQPPRGVKASPCLAQLIIDRPVIVPELVTRANDKEDEAGPVRGGEKHLSVGGKHHVEHGE